MKFRTEIEIAPLAWKIDHSSRGLSLGSCFAESVAAKLRRYKFKVESNPFGVLYNPSSVADALAALAEGRTYDRGDLAHEGGVWFSYSHHGSFADISADSALEKMNEAARRGTEALRRADYVMLTFGTAWVYERGGKVAANCHKQPASEFTRRRLTAGEIVERYAALLDGPLRGKRVMLTVSPVRHLKDGFAENSLSKAILRVAAEEIAARSPDVVYFPAFEIVNDDLRDYRFYKDDMVHPTDAAVDYVWEKFSQAALTARALELLPRIEAIVRAFEHRPFDTGTARHAAFLENSLHKARQILESCPEIDLHTETDYFSGRG